jgi:SAM-dependent methyltransferase
VDRNAAGPRVAAPELVTAPRRASMRAAIERLIAVGYGFMYDAVVSGFAPYDALVDEISALVARSAPAGRPTSVLDVSCGTGTVAARLAALGHRVTAVDAIGHLVDVARSRYADRALPLTFDHLDIATQPPPSDGAYDVLVSMHTLYWHPRPDALLAACRRALLPGGHAIFLTYGRPARVLPTFRAVRARRGGVEALRSLRWLLPTALFETLRNVDRRYLDEREFRGVLAAAGFDVLEVRETFLAGISRLAWARVPA